VKEINNMHLQNVVMQLRKVCSHPILFEGPRMHEQVMDDELVDASGKMMVLERLLDALFARGHKVLVFSQFVTMLDVIEVSESPLHAATLLTEHDGRIGRTSTKAGHCVASTARRAQWNAAQKWTVSKRAATRQTRHVCSC
jgi:SNF2 family DNA or RNA helicase